LGLTVSLSDEKTGLELSENEAMIRETAALLGIQVHFEQGAEGTFVTFFQ